MSVEYDLADIVVGYNVERNQIRYYSLSADKILRVYSLDLVRATDDYSIDSDSVDQVVAHQS